MFFLCVFIYRFQFYTLLLVCVLVVKFYRVFCFVLSFFVFFIVFSFYISFALHPLTFHPSVGVRDSLAEVLVGLVAAPGFSRQRLFSAVVVGGAGQEEAANRNRCPRLRFGRGSDVSAGRTAVQRVEEKIKKQRGKKYTHERRGKT